MKKKIFFVTGGAGFIGSHLCERLLKQGLKVICVDNNLEAPETPLGHADAFWSIALAVMAHHDATTSGTTIIGDMSDWDTNRGSQIQTRNFGFDKKDL